MSRPRYQFSLAGLCGIVAVSAVGFSQNTFSRGVFAVTWVTLLLATIVSIFRPQPFWKGFVIAGPCYLCLSRVFFAVPPPVGHADVMLTIHSIVALSVACFAGAWLSYCKCPRTNRLSP
jgi:hypothetical protein